ncbi:hypothetical protein FDUTEX481_01791 [Tolypothrix sp. PCC 7601]|nr:hypothetical protein FDUTEX481_01791 [Tolypothrix sp. PCC 7601]
MFSLSATVKLGAPKLLNFWLCSSLVSQLTSQVNVHLVCGVIAYL